MPKLVIHAIVLSTDFSRHIKHRSVWFFWYKGDKAKLLLVVITLLSVAVEL